MNVQTSNKLIDTNSIKTEVFEFISAWGEAWSPKENAAQCSEVYKD